MANVPTLLSGLLGSCSKWCLVALLSKDAKYSFPDCLAFHNHLCRVQYQWRLRRCTCCQAVLCDVRAKVAHICTACDASLHHLKVSSRDVHTMLITLYLATARKWPLLLCLHFIPHAYILTTSSYEWHASNVRSTATPTDCPQTKQEQTSVSIVSITILSESAVAMLKFHGCYAIPSMCCNFSCENDHALLLHNNTKMGNTCRYLENAPFLL